MLATECCIEVLADSTSHVFFCVSFFFFDKSFVRCFEVSSCFVLNLKFNFWKEVCTFESLEKILYSRLLYLSHKKYILHFFHNSINPKGRKYFKFGVDWEEILDTIIKESCHSK